MEERKLLSTLLGLPPTSFSDRRTNFRLLMWLKDHDSSGILLAVSIRRYIHIHTSSYTHIHGDIYTYVLYYICILAMGIFIFMYMGVTAHKVEVTRTKGDNVLCLLLRRDTSPGK